MHPILVVGATGLLGSEICRLLRGSEHHVRGLVRPGSPREDLIRSFGAEIVPGDLRDVRSLERACRGAATVITTATAIRPRLPGDDLKSVDRDGQRALVDAARRSGVRRFLYVSVSPNLPRATPLVRYKREVESAVRGSGMAWVIVQPSAFMEVWFDPRAGFDVTAGKAALVGSGEAPVSYISVRDVAKAVVGAVREDSGVTRAHLPLGGPDAISTLDIVRMFEEETGRRFSVIHAPVPLVRGMGFVTRPFYPALSSVLGMAAHRAVAGDVIEPSEAARSLIPRPWSVRDFARDAARAALTERVRVLLGARAEHGSRFGGTRV